MGLEDVADVCAAEDVALGFGEFGDVDEVTIGGRLLATVVENAIAFGWHGVGGRVGGGGPEAGKVVDNAAGIGGDDAGDHVEEGGLARAAGSDEGDVLP